MVQSRGSGEVVVSVVIFPWEKPVSLTAQMQKIGQITELAGAAAFAAGIILSVHHYAIGALFVGGAAAFVGGKKLRGI